MVLTWNVECTGQIDVDSDYADFDPFVELSFALSARKITLGRLR